MQKTMTLKGFAVIMALVLGLFLALHLTMKGDLHRKAEQENALKLTLTRLQEEEKDLKNQLSIVGTEDYIVASARENFSFVNADDIRFQYSNPEALYTYTAQELRILTDEMAD